MCEQTKSQVDGLQRELDEVRTELQNSLGKMEHEKQARLEAEEGKQAMDLEKKRIESEMEGIRQEQQRLVITIRSLTDKVSIAFDNSIYLPTNYIFIRITQFKC